MSTLKRKRVWPVVLLVLAVFYLVTRLQRPADLGEVSHVPTAGGTAGPSVEPTNKDPLSGFTPDLEDPRLWRDVRGGVALREAVLMASELHRDDTTAEADIQVLNELFANYRLVLGGNPVGSDNPEIVAQLIGKNAKQLVLIAPSHPSLTEQGELLDRWGTPYYFHPLARDQMDIRSAGSDGKLWTRDDVSLGLDEQLATENGR